MYMCIYIYIFSLSLYLSLSLYIYIYIYMYMICIWAGLGSRSRPSRGQAHVRRMQCDVCDACAIILSHSQLGRASNSPC